MSIADEGGVAKAAGGGAEAVFDWSLKRPVRSGYTASND
jgi:hypothetical protein